MKELLSRIGKDSLVEVACDLREQRVEDDERRL